MAHDDPARRYHDHVRRYGVAPSDARIVALRALDLGTVRFFALTEGAGLRLRAGVTARGLVTRALDATEDWSGFLRASTDARAMAERVVWLQTDPPSAHGAPEAPPEVLDPTRPPPDVDPAAWAMVQTPTLTSDGARVSLRAWVRADASSQLESWALSAAPDGPGTLLRQRADALLSSTPEGTSEARAARARQVLKTPGHRAHRWALMHVGQSADTRAASLVGAVLKEPESAPELRMQAARTLGSLAVPAAVPMLAAALRIDPASEVRRTAAQALATIGGAPALAALASAAGQPDMLVRTEVVHALARLGRPALPVLRAIARDDPDAAVRALAAGYATAVDR
ncbi:MAG: HEAT repeat domain-containing protein [Polyangiales bacterium]